MIYCKLFRKAMILSGIGGLLLHVSLVNGSSQGASNAIHSINVRLQARNQHVAGIRVRLLNETRMLPVGDAISDQQGEVRFTRLLAGDYIVETAETSEFQATTTKVNIFQVESDRPTSQRLMIAVDLTNRKGPEKSPPGTLMADVDVNVPEEALKHYRQGSEAEASGNATDAISEFKSAVEVYPRYYSARLELGRTLRAEKHFLEAEAALKPLEEIAPTRAEPRIELGMVLLALEQQNEAVAELRKALETDDSNWIPHLYLGWALLQNHPEEAEAQFTRALQLDEKKAAQAHLSLARLDYSRGMRQEAIHHLDAYLAIAPDAPDATSVRTLLRQLQAH